MTLIGLNVIEVDGSAPPTIQGASTSVAAFNIATVRGTPGKPAMVTSFSAYVERFGGFSANQLGAYLVKGFFDNGGQFAWINRYAGAAGNAPHAASGTLPSEVPAAQALLGFTAGYRGQPDPGSWGNGLTVHAAPSFTTTIAGGHPVNADGTTVASVAGFTVGDSVVLQGPADHAVVRVATLDASNGAMTWTPALANAGAFDGTTTVSSSDFDVTVATTAGGTVETFTSLSLDHSAANFVETAMNDTLRGSRYVVAADVRQPASTKPDSFAASSTTLTGGTDGTAGTNDLIGDEVARTGFHAFDATSVQLVCCDSSDPAVVVAGLGYCEQRGDCMFVGSVPAGTVGGGTAIDYGAQFQGKKVYGALYGPNITVTDPLSKAASPIKSIPPTGHVLGVYARTAATRGIHKAPAGDDARLVGALDVEYRLSDAEHTRLVVAGSVNGIRVAPGAGIIVDASRTLSTDIRWRYVNVRLLFNYVESSLRDGLRWVRQEPNKDTLWTTVKFGSVTPFLLGLWRHGAFGAGEAKDVFTVICDATNNPPDEVDKGNLTVEVYFYPSRPAETIVVKVGQQPSGAVVAES
jgi:phage tail sheath protein FI